MSKNLGLFSLLSGIAAFVLVFLGPVFAIIAIILGVMGKRKRGQKTLATIGMWLGIVWFILVAIGYVVSSILNIPVIQ